MCNIQVFFILLFRPVDKLSFHQNVIWMWSFVFVWCYHIHSVLMLLRQKPTTAVRKHFNMFWTLIRTRLCRGAHVNVLFFRSFHSLTLKINSYLCANKKTFRLLFTENFYECKNVFRFFSILSPSSFFFFFLRNKSGYERFANIYVTSLSA